MASAQAPKAAPVSTESSFVNVEEAWADHATHAIASLRLRPPTPELAPASVRGTTMKLEIPLDVTPSDGRAGYKQEERREPVPRRQLSRRDSMKRREALLMGKEGSRRRQRWENNRLLGNPYLEPPLPSDFKVHPTYPVHTVPYFLAPLWDAKYAEQNASRRKQERKRKISKSLADGETAIVPKELKQRLKRSRAAKGLLQDLEEQVRHFIQQWEEKRRSLEDEAVIEPDSEDEEIIFVGRTGQMHDMRAARYSEDLQREKLVFDSLENDHGASFGRWLVHSIGSYYGLETWSRTVGDPARREAYVGIKEVKLKSGRRKAPGTALPRPLWALV